MDDTESIEGLRKRLAQAEAALRDRDEAATRREADIAALWRVCELNARLANEPDLRIRLEHIVEAANALLHTDRGCVQLVSADGERLEMYAYRGYEPSSPFIQHFLHEGSKPACDAARQYGRRLIIEDVATFPDLQGTADREVGLQEGILATQSTPMITRRGEMVGVLSNQFRSQHRASDDQLRLIDVLAWNAAEIVERHRAEAALRATEQRLQRVLETDAVAVLFFDHQGVLIDANDVFLSLTGYAREDIAAKCLSWQQMTPADHLAESERQMAQFMTTGRIGPYEKEYLRKDGSRAWMLFSGRDLGDGTIVELGVGISDRKRAEAVLRASEERQAFLLKLSDALRPVGDPVEVQRIATHMLGDHLRASRVFYVIVDEDGDTATIFRDYTDGVPSRSGRYSLAAFSSHAVSEWRAGRTASSSDVDADPHYSDAERNAYASVSTRAGFGVPLIKNGRLMALLGVNQASPRHWSDDDIEVASEVAERTWTAVERAHAEAALRESEARLAATFESVPAGLAAIDLEGRSILANAEYRRFLPQGIVPSRDPEHGGRWKAWDEHGRVIAPRDYPAARALRGERVTPGLEMLFHGEDGRTIWTNVATVPTYDDAGGVTGVVTAVSDINDRKLADQALRESEERFAQFANASAAGLWIRNADTLTMEFASRAIEAIYGIRSDAILGEERKWAALIVPDDRDVALEHIQQARRGEVVTHEFRIQRASDGAFRWIRNTDFPLHDAKGCVQRIGGIAEDVTEAKLAAEHASVLLAELQHRVRNIMAMIRSVTRRTGERAASVPDYAELMMGRLLALARVQALLTRAANVSVGIAGIVRDEVSVQAQHDGQYDLDGPDVALAPKAAEVLTLAVHELATNALKYGALSTADGKVTVRWTVFEKRGVPWLAFHWTEEGTPAPSQPTRDAPRRRGFGTELIEGRIPYELRGRGKLAIEPGGARCHLEFPLKEGASILETGAPQRMTVFGGSLDMSGGPDLSGCRVLVVEDDFYLATDAARALGCAGADVMGPCATEEDARAELDEQRPDVVVVDINLGQGLSFKLAETLKDRDIPFVFTTGYDAEVIPAEFRSIERLEKPLQLRQIVAAVAKLKTAA